MDSLITICTGNADADYRVEMSGGAKNIFFFQGQERVRAYTHTHIYIYIYIYLLLLYMKNVYVTKIFTSS